MVPTKLFRPLTKPYWSDGEDRRKQTRRSLDAVINDGVDHVDDPHFGLPVLLLGASDGDAQAAPHWHRLILRTGLIVPAEKFFMDLEGADNAAATRAGGRARDHSSTRMRGETGAASATLEVIDLPFRRLRRRPADSGATEA